MDHLGIAVRSIEQAARLYVQGLGLRLERVEVVPEQGVKVGFLPLGEVEIEFLEPLSAESAVARFLEKRGEGLHHLCIEVPDIRAAMARLREQGARLLGEEPSPGAGGSLVVFVHPHSANGVLLELCQKRRE
jgi:methylmalonyl-CoA epimerase